MSAKVNVAHQLEVESVRQESVVYCGCEVSELLCGVDKEGIFCSSLSATEADRYRAVPSVNRRLFGIIGIVGNFGIFGIVGDLGIFGLLGLLGVASVKACECGILCAVLKHPDRAVPAECRLYEVHVCKACGIYRAAAVRAAYGAACVVAVGKCESSAILLAANSAYV